MAPAVDDVLEHPPDHTMLNNPKGRHSIVANDIPIENGSKSVFSKVQAVKKQTTKRKGDRKKNLPNSKTDAVLPPSPKHENGDMQSTVINSKIQTVLNESVTASPATKKSAPSPEPENTEDSSALTPVGHEKNGTNTENESDICLTSTEADHSLNALTPENTEKVASHSDERKTNEPESRKSLLSQFMQHFSPARSKTQQKTTQPKQKKVNKTAKTKKEKKPVGSQSTPITSFFEGVRRSTRKPKSVVEQENQSELEDAILAKKHEVDGSLKVVVFEVKGRGVVAQRAFERGDFVVEYAGDLLAPDQAADRNLKYEEEKKGSYMYYFSYNNTKYCVDATPETDRLGRLVNHSYREPNCQTRAVGVGGQPYLILTALRRIHPGEELTYDYGDRSKQSVEDNPWLLST